MAEVIGQTTRGSPAGELWGRLRAASVAHASMLLLVAALVFAADGAALVHAIRGNPYWKTSTDFGVYVGAANFIAGGQNPYVVQVYATAHEPGVHHGYAYPPALADLLVLPIKLLGETALRYVWLALSLGALGACLALLLRGFGNPVPWPWFWPALAFTLASGLVRNDLYHGEVNFALLLCFTLGLRLYAAGHAGRAGAAWGIMFAVKPFLGVLVLYLIWRRAWRAALASAVVSGVVVLVSFLPTLPTGLAAVSGWIQASRYDASPPFALQPDNHALDALLQRLFTHNEYTSAWVESVAALQLLRLGLLVLLACAFLLALPRGAREHEAPTPPARLLVEPSFVLGLAMAFGPLTEGDHLFLLLPGLIGAIKMTRQVDGRASSARWWWAAMGWALLFGLLASPVRSGLGVSPALTAMLVGTHPHGIGILWTGRVGFVLLGVMALTAHALRPERETASPIVRGVAFLG